MKKDRPRCYIPLVFMSIFYSVSLVSQISCGLRGKSDTHAYQIFTKYLSDKIPDSVGNIRLDQPGKIYGHKYVLRFDISRDDMILLTKTKPFMKVWNVTYKNGILNWDWDRGEAPYWIAKHGESVPLYGHTRKPGWFKPELWDNPVEAYGLYKIGDLVNTQVLERNVEELSGRNIIQILIYNEKKSEAYFIVLDTPN